MSSTVMQLIHKLRSPNNKITLQAVEELRVRGWLGDGSLEGASLRYVHLEWADLCMANLRGADLSMAQLQGADLSMADLEEANLSMAQMQGTNLSAANLRGIDLYQANLQVARNLSEELLAQAGRLRGALLLDGDRYDGRFNLAGDIEVARAGGIDPNDPVAMARYYGIDLEDYQRGQDWAKEHLESVQENAI